MNLRTAFVLSLAVISMPLLAQVEPSISKEPAALPELVPQAIPESAAAPRKLKLISESQTLNYIALFDGVGAGTVSDSIILESNGKIGIGLIPPALPISKLHVGGDIYAVATKAGGGQGISVTQVGYVTNAVVQWDTGAQFEGRSHVTPGVMNPGGVYGAFIVARNYGGSAYAAVGGRFIAANVDAGTVTNAYAAQVEVTKGTGAIVNGYGLMVRDIQATNAYGVFQEGVDDTNVFRGKIVIGQPIVAPAFVPPVTNALNVNGDAHFSGTVTGTNIKARYQDVAEWVPATTDLTPGTVVILNRDRNNEVMASATAYDTTVAGVVSAQPGISLGIEGEGMEQIATTGRVQVRVDARTSPVRVGDLLVTSATPGMAMRSEPMDLNGRKFHQPGTIIGKALEPLSDGVGEILVLLSMQ